MKKNSMGEKKYSVINLYDLLITFFLIAFSDTVIFSFNSNASIVALGQYTMVTASVVFLLAFFVKCQNSHNAEFVFLIIALLFIVLSAVYHSEFSGGYISRIALFALGFSLCSVCNVNKILQTYQKLMVWICIFSLISMIVMTAYGPLQFLPKIVNTSGRQFYWFGLSFMTPGNPVRNYGFFTEPSRFQAYINLAIIIELFYNHQKNYKRILLFLVTLLTTYSTTGFVSFAFIFAAFILSKKCGFSIEKKILIVIATFSIVFALNKFTDFFLASSAKIELGAKSESYSVRYNSIFGGIRMVFEHFWFGTGVANANQAFIDATKDLYAVRETTTYTNTIIMNLSKFGIVPGVYYISNLFRTLKRFAGNTLVAILLFLAMFCMLSGISFIESIMFNVLAFMHLGMKKQCGNHADEGKIIKYAKRAA